MSAESGGHTACLILCRWSWIWLLLSVRSILVCFASKNMLSDFFWSQFQTYRYTWQQFGILFLYHCNDVGYHKIAQSNKMYLCHQQSFCQNLNQKWSGIVIRIPDRSRSVCARSLPKCSGFILLSASGIAKFCEKQLLTVRSAKKSH